MLSGMLADMFIGALGMIGFSWAASPIATELEIVRALRGHSDGGFWRRGSGGILAEGKWWG